MKRASRVIGPAVMSAALIVGSVIGFAPSAGANTPRTAAPSCTGTYGPTAPAITLNITVVVQGTSVTITVTGTGFGINEAITLTIASTSQTIGHTMSDANGHFVTQVQIPSNLALGSHTITATGNTCGDPASAGITVVAPGSNGAAGGGAAGGGVSGGSANGGASSSGGTSGGRVAFTGTDAIATTAIGAAAIGAGGLLVLSSRKRRRNSFG